MDLAKAIVLLMLVQLQTSPAWGCSSGSRTYRFFIADERSVLTEVVWCTERCTILIFGASQDFRPKDRPGRYLIAELRRFAVLTRTLAVHANRARLTSYSLTFSLTGLPVSDMTVTGTDEAPKKRVDLKIHPVLAPNESIESAGSGIVADNVSEVADEVAPAEQITVCAFAESARQRLIHVDLHLEVRNDRKLDFAMAHFEVPIESVVYLYSGKSGFVERT